MNRSCYKHVELKIIYQIQVDFRTFSSEDLRPMKEAAGFWFNIERTMKDPFRALTWIACTFP